MKMTSQLWGHLYWEHSQPVQYFAHHFSFTTRQVLYSFVCYEKMNKFNKQTCLNIKH